MTIQSFYIRELPERVVVIEVKDQVDPACFLKNSIKQYQLVYPIFKRASRIIADTLIKNGVLEIVSRDLPEQHIAVKEFRIRLTCIPPKDAIHKFSQQLDEAEQNGMLIAVKFLRKNARKLSKLAWEGPIQAIAFEGIAKEIEQFAITPKYTKE